MAIALLPVLCEEFLGLLLTQEWTLLISRLLAFAQPLLQGVYSFPGRLPEKLVCTLFKVEVVDTAIGITARAGGIILNRGNAERLFPRLKA